MHVWCVLGGREEVVILIVTVKAKVPQELVSKMNKSTNQFCQKGKEMQFTFNLAIEESISSAKQQLVQLKAKKTNQQVAVKKVEARLDEGMKVCKFSKSDKTSK